ncbi:MAG TPA: CotH kinase family protein [Polyangiaceae bacterium]|nr:CotH kinase family protein [Polyangiaceae bacterium]
MKGGWSLRAANVLELTSALLFAAACSGGPAAPGQPSAAGAGGAESATVAKGSIGDEVFDDTEVQSYYLTMSDAEYAKLMDLSTLLLDKTTVNEDRYVDASLEFGGRTLPSIGVRFKGQFSIWGCVDGGSGTRRVRVEPFFGNVDVCQRFSLKLDFNHNDSGARLNGLKKLNLHAMSADPSKLRERLGYSLYRDMDVLAPRAVHARVYINGSYHGLFAAVEEVDGRFTAHRFPDSGDGNLYKEIWPAAPVTSADAEAALKTNDDPDTRDVSDFLAFKSAVVSANESDFATKLAPYVDFDYLARYIVVNRAINDFDGVMAFYYGWGPPPANHNLYWYHDTDSGRFMLVPWDLDKSFWYPEPNFWSDNAANDRNVTPNWNVVTRNCNGYTAWFDNLGNPYKMMAIDCDPLLRLLRAQIYADQKAKTEQFIAGPFSEANVRAKVEAWRAQIADAIQDDPLLDSARWQASVDALLADLPKFQSNVRLMMSGLISE